MFGLIGHLTSLAHAQRVTRELGYEEYAEWDLEVWCSAPPQIVDEITVRSITGQVARGLYVESFFLPEMLAGSRIKTAIRKILNAMAHAQKHGIDITALGGFSSIVFENFNLSQMLRVRNIELDIHRFTTGNTHTAYIICRQVEAAMVKYGIELTKATVAVCGATGDIGSAVCRWLAQRSEIGELLLVARDPQRLADLQGSLGRGQVMAMPEALPKADVVVWVTSMTQGMSLNPAELRRPCVLIDGGYPKNLATQVQAPGVYVLNGGVVEHSLDIDWRIMKTADMLNPARHLFACFAESMLLELEGWHTNFSWGRNNIAIESMEKIGEVSQKHGFRPLIA
ncbi:MAG: long-chain acyl-[acyl-carrier-protein] reductase [Oscillatoriales cyanobacterium SM2_1_8]|nr:long-chain acyl-[acyl-carrier-protein] reductase [Oscillatoriales cyanobacterium SM2_1_8]